MTGVRAMTQGDVGWAAEVLARRRAELAPHAPRLWRPAPDAVERHREHLGFLLGAGPGAGYRTDEGLMILVEGPHGWVVDDAWVPPGRWESEGVDLWARAAEHTGSAPVRWVCPVAEKERGAFARRRGLALVGSWWHAEVEGSGGSDDDVRVDGAVATLVAAPPVYDPGGPVLFLREVRDVAAVARAPREAARRGAPLVVVDQPVGSDALARALADDGYVRHCDFLAG